MDRPSYKEQLLILYVSQYRSLHIFQEFFLWAYHRRPNECYTWTTFSGFSLYVINFFLSSSKDANLFVVVWRDGSSNFYDSTQFSKNDLWTRCCECRAWYVTLSFFLFVFEDASLIWSKMIHTVYVSVWLF